MIKLNIDEQKSMNFEVNIQGVDYKNLHGSLKFIIDKIEYGFPVKILSDAISVDIPPLEEIVKRGLDNNEVTQCKLEIFGDGFYLNPWNGKFELVTTPKIVSKTPSITTKESIKPSIQIEDAGLVNTEKEVIKETIKKKPKIKTDRQLKSEIKELLS